MILNDWGFQTGLFKSLITNVAGFLLWLSVTKYYDWGFQRCFSAKAIILPTDMIYSTMKGIVPSHCRLTTRHLGATLFKLRLHQLCKSHVAASMHHNTWGLMQSHFLFILFEDPTHHIIMSRPLGATNCSCQKFKVHKPQSITLKDPLLSW